MKFLKIRDVPELEKDPRFHYMIGRLVGTTEMLAYYVTLHGDEKMRGMANRTYATLEFFFDPDEFEKIPVPLPLPPQEEITQIIAP